MIDLSNNKASLDLNIPKYKFFDEETIKKYSISDIKWLMSIKPSIRNVEKHINGKIRMEEIEVFCFSICQMPDFGIELNVLKQIHSKVSYPCVIIIQYKNKYKISAWNFIDGTIAANHNILQSYYITSWIHEPIYSKQILENITAIQDLLRNGEGDIKELYDTICHHILVCCPKYLGSYTHLQRIVYDLTGNSNHPVLNEIDSIKRHSASNPKARYEKKEYSTTMYQYFYEYEEIWHAFMRDEQIKNIIEKRRYSDADEMITKIDLKYFEAEQNQW